MEYLLKVKDDKQGKALISQLKALDYVEVEEQEPEIDLKDFRAMIRKAEKSKSLSLEVAMEKSSEWKKKLQTSIC